MSGQRDRMSRLSTNIYELLLPNLNDVVENLELMRDEFGAYNRTDNAPAWDDTQECLVLARQLRRAVGNLLNSTETLR